MKNIKTLTAVALAVSLIFSAGCGVKNNSSKVDNKNTDKKEAMELKIGVMPAVDSAPIFLAAKKGYFKELGLNVNFQVYTNIMNRQSALQSGELDGAMTDVIALINNVQNGFDIKVTTSTDGSFPVLVKKGFEEKKDIKVGTGEISVANYIADSYLGDKYNIEKIYLNEIPARLEMAKQGKLDMAIVPEPIASQGVLDGLDRRIINSKDEYSPDIMVFSGKAIKNKEKELKIFHEAYNKAVEDINNDDNIAKDILIEQLKLKPELKDKIILPKYNRVRIPSKEYIERIMSWNERVLKKKVNVKYEDLVEGKFVK